MGKYLLQKFLPNCNTDDINLENFTCNDKNNVQRISISELDEKIDTEENLISYLSLFSKKNPIVLLYDRPNYDNHILQEYAKKTLKSYIYWIRYYGYECYWENKEINNVM